MNRKEKSNEIHLSDYRPDGHDWKSHYFARPPHSNTQFAQNFSLETSSPTSVVFLFSQTVKSCLSHFVHFLPHHKFFLFLALFPPLPLFHFNFLGSWLFPCGGEHRRHQQQHKQKKRKWKKSINFRFILFRARSFAKMSIKNAENCTATAISLEHSTLSTNW